MRGYTYACSDDDDEESRQAGRQAVTLTTTMRTVSAPLFLSSSWTVLQKRGSSDPVLVVVSVSALITDR